MTFGPIATQNKTCPVTVWHILDFLAILAICSNNETKHFIVSLNEWNINISMPFGNILYHLFPPYPPPPHEFGLWCMPISFKEFHSIHKLLWVDYSFNFIKPLLFPAFTWQKSPWLWGIYIKRGSSTETWSRRISCLITKVEIYRKQFYSK